MLLSGTTMTVMGEPFECVVSSYPGGITDGVVLPDTEIVTKLPDIGRRAIKPGIMPTDFTSESVSPSSLHDEEAVSVSGVKTVSYGDGLTIKLTVEGVERGTLLHRCFELMSENEMDVDTLSKLTGYQFCTTELGMISKAAASFEVWVANQLKPQHIAREIPVLALNNTGSVVNGSIDMLIETASGFWIIDHKSDQTDNLELSFAKYLPQLNCYADALTAARPDKPLLGVGVNWISRGAVSMFAV